MRDAALAIEAALKELIEARRALPDEFGTEIDKVIEETKVLLESLLAQTPAATAGSATDSGEEPG